MSYKLFICFYFHYCIFNFLVLFVCFRFHFSSIRLRDCVGKKGFVLKIVIIGYLMTWSTTKVNTGPVDLFIHTPIGMDL